MQVGRSDAIRGGMMGLALAAGIGTLAIPLIVWRSDQAPEFYGAFTAAIVAAIAVVLGAHYQSHLTRKRDAELHSQEQFAHAVDLCYWLEYASGEMEFISDVLARMRQHLDDNGKSVLEWTPTQYREVVSSEFMNELTARAKAAARLPLSLAEPVAKSLYQTFSLVERLHWGRGISENRAVTAEFISNHEKLVRKNAERLRAAQEVLSDYLKTIRK